MKTKIFKHFNLGLAGLIYSAIAVAQPTPKSLKPSKAPLAPLSAVAPVAEIPYTPAKPAEWVSTEAATPSSPNSEIGVKWINTVEKSKKISRSFNVDPNDKLSLKNQYGKVSINTWAKNEIKVDIEIKGFDKDEAGAQKFVDMVKIDESRSTDLISFQTHIEREKTGSWSMYNKSKDGKENRRGVEINYVIYMPGKNPLDINNKYGATVLPNFDGQINIDNSYGSFIAEKIDHRENKINVRYGSATIGAMAAGNLNVAYGNLKLGHGTGMQAKVSYGSAKITALSGGGDISVAYGNLKVEEFSKVDANLNIQASYSSVAMKMSESASFNFDITTNYGGFNYPSSKVEITGKTPGDDTKSWSSAKNYKGRYGKGAEATVFIKSSYGSVKFE